ncbi:hypothetical protein EDB86DRAFT_2920826 [Lactarius hatsudake]|nr:hypothetical protein EDB86DRAFT_2920826 [Lactarius hatsudake]
MVTVLARIRSMTHGILEYSEEAMYRTRTSPGPSSEKDRAAEITAVQRFRYFGSVEGADSPEISSGNSSFSRSALGVSFNDYPEIGPTLEKLDLLEELLSGIRNIDITEIDEAIERGRTVLASAPTNLLTSGLFIFFGLILFEAFERTNKIENLNESISTHRRVYERPSMHFMHSWISQHLHLSLHIRLSLSFPDHRTQDLDEVTKLFSQNVNDAHLTLPTRFGWSCIWAYATTCHTQRDFSHSYCLARPYLTLNRPASRKQLRPLKEGGPCFGQKCVTFVRRSINFNRNTHN